MQNWIRTLERIKAFPKPWTMATAKKMISEGRKSQTESFDSKGAVFYIVASGLIRDKLSELAPTTKKQKLAAATYNLLIGKCEAALDMYDFKAMHYFETKHCCPKAIQCSTAIRKS